MSTSLLDLSDEILNLIGQYVNRDHFIPIPSFGPHWQPKTDNPINPNISRDIRSLRATCRRIRAVCKNGGMHVILRDMGSVEKEERRDKSVGRDMRGTVSRLQVDIANPCLESDHHIWGRFARHVESFPRLEEMIIQRGPICYHNVLSLSLLELTQTLIGISDALGETRTNGISSLSIEVNCPDCSMDLPTLLIPRCPNLKHLKFFLSPSTHSASWDPLKELKELFVRSKKKPEQYLSELETLYLRYPWSSRGNIWKNWGKVIKESFSLFPKLKEFHITTVNDKNELTFGTYLICSRDTPERYKSGEKGKGKESEEKWKFEVMNLEDGDWRNSWSLEQMMTYLSPPSTLKLFDPIIVIQPGESRPHHLTPGKSNNKQKSVYHDTQSYEESRFDGLLARYETLLRSQMKAAAEELVDLVPSLEEGAFWERGTEVSYDDWYRWTWRKVVDQGGEVRVEVVDKPFVLSKSKRT